MASKVTKLSIIFVLGLSTNTHHMLLALLHFTLHFSVARYGIRWNFIPCSLRGMIPRRDQGMKFHCGAQGSYNSSIPKGQMILNILEIWQHYFILQPRLITADTSFFNLPIQVKELAFLFRRSVTFYRVWTATLFSFIFPPHILFFSSHSKQVFVSFLASLNGKRGTNLGFSNSAIIKLVKLAPVFAHSMTATQGFARNKLFKMICVLEIWLRILALLRSAVKFVGASFQTVDVWWQRKLAPAALRSEISSLWSSLLVESSLHLSPTPSNPKCNDDSTRRDDQGMKFHLTSQSGNIPSEKGTLNNKHAPLESLAARNKKETKLSVAVE